MAGRGTTASLTDVATGVTVSLALNAPPKTRSARESTLLSNFENLTGSAFGGDALTGDAGANILGGAGGNDALEGGAGNDMLYGDDGTTRWRAATAMTSWMAATGIDTASYAGAAAAVTVSLALQDAAQNTVGAGSDTLTSFENLTGSAFNDTLTGDGDDNKLSGGGGNDMLTAATATTAWTAVTGTDTASYEDAAAGVTVNLALSRSAEHRRCRHRHPEPISRTSSARPLTTS